VRATHDGEKPMSEDKPSRQKFKWTKELVHIALNDGMTQEEISKVCRTQQSVVSSWKNGKSKATEQQLAELLRRYGARLNRTTAKVYLVYEDPKGTWEETEIGRRLLELTERKNKHFARVTERRKADVDAHNLAAARDREAQQATKPKVTPPEPAPGLLMSYPFQPVHFTDDELAVRAQIETTELELQNLLSLKHPHLLHAERLTELYQQDFLEQGPHRLVQVEGPVVFRYTFSVLSSRAFRRSVDLSREPIARWVLHDLHRGKLLLVSQSRRQLTGTAKHRWGIEFEEAKSEASKLAQAAGTTLSPMLSSDYVNSTDDAGRWVSFISGPLTVEELLRNVDDYLADTEMIHSPHDELVLPYLIRKALVEHGHPVPGIDRITGLE